LLVNAYGLSCSFVEQFAFHLGVTGFGSKSVLAGHYTDFSPEKLKEKYQR
jgi:hypothetical protein